MFMISFILSIICNCIYIYIILKNAKKINIINNPTSLHLRNPTWHIIQLNTHKFPKINPSDINKLW